MGWVEKRHDLSDPLFEEKNKDQPCSLSHSLGVVFGCFISGVDYAREFSKKTVGYIQESICLSSFSEPSRLSLCY